MPYFGTLVIISGLLGFWQEGGASNAAEKFLVLVQVKATVLSNGHNRVRLCKSTRFDGNAGDHWSDNNPSLDTFGNAAGISTVVVEFCAGARGDRAVVRYCGSKCETSVLSTSKILVVKAQHLSVKALDIK